MAALKAHAGDSDRPQNQTIEHVLALLEQALTILDERDSPPHIGARLQEVIEFLRNEISSRGS
jgi:hypothetical protein